MTTQTLDAVDPIRGSALHLRVARNVRAELARNGVTQARAAQALAMGQQGVSLRLRGIVPFALDELEILAALLLMAPEDFMTGRPGPGSGPDFDGAAAVVRRQGLEPRTRWLSTSGAGQIPLFAAFDVAAPAAA